MVSHDYSKGALVLEGGFALYLRNGGPDTSSCKSKKNNLKLEFKTSTRRTDNIVALKKE